MSHTNTTRWTGTTHTSQDTAAYTTGIGTVLGTDRHHYDFIVRQSGSLDVTPDYVAGSATDGKIHGDLAQAAVSALALVLRSKLQGGSATNFAKINRIVVTVDMKS
jgi:hypothetical protein